MALDTTQQILKLITNSKHILIVSPSKGEHDSLCWSLAVLRMFQKMNKPADLITENPQHAKLDFLPHADNIQTNISSLQKLTISLDIKDNKIDDFSYDIQDDKLNIFLSPQKANLTKSDISIHHKSFKYDLIITIGAHDLESLGGLYQNNTDFFYSTPIVNIDISPSNEHYGQINLIDLSASSAAEIIFDLINTANPQFIDEDIATHLLADLVIRTKSFKDPRTTPKSLSLAADLIRLGAKRDQIVNNLYGNKKLSTLNLWGRVLARLKQDTLYKMAWSMVSQADFQKAQSTQDDLSGITEEILLNSPQIETILILYETKTGQIAAELHTSKNHDALELARAFGPLGNKSRADFYLETDKLFEAEEMTINQIRSRIKI